VREADNLTPYSADVKKSMSLNSPRPLWACMARNGCALPFFTDYNVYYRHGSSVGIAAVTARTTRNRFRAVLSIALQTDLLIPPELLYTGAGIAFCGEKWPEPGNDPSPSM
jgi:hypothetical protein